MPETWMLETACKWDYVAKKFIYLGCIQVYAHD